MSYSMRSTMALIHRYRILTAVAIAATGCSTVAPDSSSTGPCECKDREVLTLRLQELGSTIGVFEAEGEKIERMSKSAPYTPSARRRLDSKAEYRSEASPGSRRSPSDSSACLRRLNISSTGELTADVQSSAMMNDYIEARLDGLYAQRTSIRSALNHLDLQCDSTGENQDGGVLESVTPILGMLQFFTNLFSLFGALKGFS